MRSDVAMVFFSPPYKDGLEEGLFNWHMYQLQVFTHTHI